MKKAGWLLFLCAVLLSLCVTAAFADSAALPEAPEPTISEPAVTEPATTVPTVSEPAVTVPAGEPIRYEHPEFCPDGKVSCTGSIYGEWRTQYYVPCEHGDARINDKYQTQTEFRVYECDSCDYSHVDILTHSRVFCMSKG